MKNFFKKFGWISYVIIAVFIYMILASFSNINGWDDGLKTGCGQVVTSIFCTAVTATITAVLIKYGNDSTESLNKSQTIYDKKQEAYIQFIKLIQKISKNGHLDIDVLDMCTKEKKNNDSIENDKYQNKKNPEFNDQIHDLIFQLNYVKLYCTNIKIMEKVTEDTGKLMSAMNSYNDKMETFKNINLDKNEDKKNEVKKILNDYYLSIAKIVNSIIDQLWADLKCTNEKDFDDFLPAKTEKDFVQQMIKDSGLYPLSFEDKIQADKISKLFENLQSEISESLGLKLEFENWCYRKDNDQSVDWKNEAVNFITGFNKEEERKFVITLPNEGKYEVIFKNKTGFEYCEKFNGIDQKVAYVDLLNKDKVKNLNIELFISFVTKRIFKAAVKELSEEVNRTSDYDNIENKLNEFKNNKINSDEETDFYFEKIRLEVANNKGLERKENSIKTYDECVNFAKKYDSLWKEKSNLINSKCVLLNDLHNYKESIEETRKNIIELESLRKGKNLDKVEIQECEIQLARCRSQQGQNYAYNEEYSKAIIEFNKAIKILKNKKLIYKDREYDQQRIRAYLLHALIEDHNFKKYEKIAKEYFGTNDKLKQIDNLKDRYYMFVFIKGLYAFDLDNKQLNDIMSKFEGLTIYSDETDPWQLIYKYMAFIFYKLGKENKASYFFEKASGLESKLDVVKEELKEMHEQWNAIKYGITGFDIFEKKSKLTYMYR